MRREIETGVEEHNREQERQAAKRPENASWDHEAGETKLVGETTTEKVVDFLRSRYQSGFLRKEPWISDYENDPKVIPVSTHSMGGKDYNPEAVLETISDPEVDNSSDDYDELVVLDAEKLTEFKYSSVSGSYVEFKRNKNGGFDVYGASLGENAWEDMDKIAS